MVADEVEVYGCCGCSFGIFAHLYEGMLELLLDDPAEDANSSLRFFGGMLQSGTII